MCGRRTAAPLRNERDGQTLFYFANAAGPTKLTVMHANMWISLSILSTAINNLCCKISLVRQYTENNPYLMETAPQAHAYIPILQKPKCCAVACLQMILYRNGYGLFDQEELAIEFGVKVGADDVGAFRKDMPIMTRFNFDDGISTLESVGKINAFFDKKNIGLHAEAFKHSSIESVDDMVAKQLKSGHDVWAEYHSQEIYPGDPTNNRIHDALVESIDPDKATLVLK